MSLKAFAVTETDENTGGIVFAECAVIARRIGAATFSDGEFSGVSCRRAPWADHLADKPVPASLMIDHGWWYECSQCGETINSDWLEEHDLPVEGVIGTQHSRIFCCEICEARFNLDEALRRDCERRAIEILKTYVLKRFPSVIFRADDSWKPHAYARARCGIWAAEEVVVFFDFPGQVIAPASCGIRRNLHHDRLVGPLKPEFWCCAGDREAFEAWADAPASRDNAEAGQ